MNGFSRRHFFLAAGSAAGASLVRGSERQATPPAAAPRLRLTCADYLRFTPLATGDLRPAQLQLDWVRGERSSMLRRALTDPAVDGGEGSMLQHLVRLDAGDRSMVAVPVFPLRNFTARDFYVRKGSALTPTDLDGKRIGIYSWAASGAVWYRHLLRHLGQRPASMSWVVGGADQPSRVQPVVPLPANVKDAPEGKSLSDLLLAGEIDAMCAPLPPGRHHPEDGPIVRLVPDFRGLEQRYFQQTRCFPPQHALLVKAETWKRDPSVGRRLVEVFERCEREFQASQRLFPYGTPWQLAEIEATGLLMGPDFHAPGLERNRHAIDVFCQSAFEDGLTKRRLFADDYFAEFLRG